MTGKVTPLRGGQAAEQPRQVLACSACKYFSAISGEVRGECRRRPPVLVVHLDDAAETCFPRMKADGWCGAFVAVEADA